MRNGKSKQRPGTGATTTKVPPKIEIGKLQSGTDTIRRFLKPSEKLFS